MTETGHKYLLFTLHGRRYALDLAQVAEVDDPPVTWPIPCAPACYPGAMNFHGDIVAVMDLAAFLGFPAIQRMEKVVVLDRNIAALAFLVERVERIVPQEQAQKSDPRGDNRENARISLPEGDAELLDAVAIAAAAADSINNRNVDNSSGCF